MYLTTTDLPPPGPPAPDSAVARAVRHGAVQARHAPSVHNTQPWTFVLAEDSLTVRHDWSRRLAVLDPAGRQLVLSAGCAVSNVRVALAAAGWGAGVDRRCDGQRPAVAAAVVADAAVPPDPGLAALDEWVTRRHSNRRRLTAEPVAPDVVRRLLSAAEAEGAELHELADADDRLAVARLSQLADRWGDEDPAYRAELRHWDTDDDHRDVPMVSARTLPQRTTFLLATRADTPAAWERAGEALQRVWLELTRAGYVASLHSRVVETPYTRVRLRDELGLATHPHVLLRVGRAAPSAATRRRRLSELLVHAR